MLFKRKEQIEQYTLGPRIKRVPISESQTIAVNTYPDYLLAKCVECAEIFSNKRLLTVHKKEIHPKPKTKVKCPECTFATRDGSYLRKHIQAIHRDEPGFFCKQCPYSCKWEGGLVRHMISDHGQEKPYKCTTCPYSTLQQSMLQVHVNAVHLKLRKFKCQECEYAGGRRSNLEMHVNLVHRRNKKFPCSMCSYLSGTPGNLRAHTKRVHKDYTDDIKTENV